ncbi:hypothetical protein PTKIN_Ptkin13bG0145400 [Pterospermum kingtungense]
MMLKFSAGFMFFLCTAALSCWELQGLPTLETQDFNLSVPVREIQVLRHEGVNRRATSEAKGDDKDEYEEHQKIHLSKKSKSGKGAYGGANIAHHTHRPAKNSASSLVTPPMLLSNAVFLAFPSVLLIKLFF